MKELGLTPGRLLTVADVSGSMTTCESRPLYTSIASAIMTAEILHEVNSPFANTFITFSEEPTFHTLSPSKTFVEKVTSTKNASWGYSTNLVKVWEKIIEIGVNKHLTSDQMPDRILIVSDMQFNKGTGKYNEEDEITLFRKFMDVEKEYTPPTYSWDDDADSTDSIDNTKELYRR